MKYLFLLLALNFSNKLFSQTDIEFFEAISVKPIDEIDAQLTEAGYNLTKSDSVKIYFVWQNALGDGFTYQKGLFKISSQSKGNGLVGTTLRPQLIFKYITSEKEKYYAIQSSVNNTPSYIKGKPLQTKTGIKTKYSNGDTEVILEKIVLSKEEGTMYRVTYIINHPK